VAPVAVVTGAASGIGAACVRQLIADGYTVVGFDLRESDGCARSLVVDVSDAAAVEAAFASIEGDLGPIEAAVTAAGYYERVDILDLDDSHVDRIVDVLINGTANVCRSALRRMLPRGSGSICTIGSELGLCGDADAAHYSACKGAVHAMTKTMAREAAPHGVRVNCVAPGPTDTPLMTDELRDPAYIASLSSTQTRSQRWSDSFSMRPATISSARSSPRTPERSYDPAAHGDRRSPRPRHRCRSGHRAGDS
jgi:2-hydroxycyclohexanecarboxyl-CoA dehydrogenase